MTVSGKHSHAQEWLLGGMGSLTFGWCRESSVSMYACPHVWCLDAPHVVSLSQPSETWDWCCCISDAKPSLKLGKNAFAKVLSCGHLDFSVVDHGLSSHLQHHAVLHLERKVRGGIIKKKKKARFLKLFSEVTPKKQTSQLKCISLSDWLQLPCSPQRCCGCHCGCDWVGCSF